MIKEIFRVGDRVFDVMYGWGKVISILERSTCEASWVYVEFQVKNVLRSYTCDGRLDSNDPYPRLSFTEYTLEGFSQERPVDYTEYEGKWGVFWDNNPQHFRVMGKLVGYIPNSKKPFKGIRHKFRYFEPLTDEQLKALRLKNY